MNRSEIKFVLSDAGATDWTIVTGAEASVSERYAAEELQKFLAEIGGALLPIVQDSEPRRPHEILIGFGARASVQPASAAEESLALGDEGYVIATGGDSIRIAGGARRGTLYGIYGFLERLGCRWFSSKVSRIPRRTTLAVGEIYDRQVPALEYREPFIADAFNADWSARNKCNGHYANLTERHGGSIKYAHPWVHTYEHLVPVDRYFDEHPEYFSEVNGVRQRNMTQICLSNPDVFDIVLAAIRQWIADNPDVNIVSVSQNDWLNPCQCADCQAVYEEEESYSGGLIRFLNKLAAVLEQESPHVALDTLAYQYTRKAPKLARPHPSIIVRLCSIECCFSHPLETCHQSMSLMNSKGSGATFIEDLQAWSKVCNRLYIWDYVTNFSNYVLPHPNLAVLKPNLQLFAANSVKGVFEQGSYSAGGGGEFAELRMYLLSRLLWNPEADDSLLIDEFLTGYYGPGGVHLRRYIDELHRIVKDDHIHVGIYDRANEAYLTPELLALADECFDKAEALAGDDETLLRVQTARLPIRWAKLAAQPTETPGRDAKLDELQSDAVAIGITQLSEHIPVEDTIADAKKGVLFAHFARYKDGWSPFKEHNEHLDQYT